MTGYLDMHNAFKISWKLIKKSVAIKIQLFAIVAISILLVFFLPTSQQIVEMLEFCCEQIIFVVSRLLGLFFLFIVIFVVLDFPFSLYNQTGGQPSIFDKLLAWVVANTAVYTLAWMFAIATRYLLQLENSSLHNAYPLLLAVGHFLLLYVLVSFFNVLTSVYNLARTVAMFKMKEIKEIIDAQKN